MSNAIERRFVSSERATVRAIDADGKKKIKGYGAVFYDGTADTEYELWNDQYGMAIERVTPEAFDNSLASKADVRSYFNHDPNQVLGRTSSGTLSLSKDTAGLIYEIEPGDTSVAKDVITHIERKDVTGASFGFSIPPEGQRWTSTTDADGRTIEIRELLKVDLIDVGPVSNPAYPATTANFRAIGDPKEARAARDEWKKTEEKPKLNRSAVLTKARLAEIECG